MAAGANTATATGTVTDARSERDEEIRVPDRRALACWMGPSLLGVTVLPRSAPRQPAKA